MNLDQAQESYRNDPAFHNIVNAMVHWIMQAQVTPAEVRAAAVLASVKAEGLTRCRIDDRRLANEVLENMNATAVRGAGFVR